MTTVEMLETMHIAVGKQNFQEASSIAIKYAAEKLCDALDRIEKSMTVKDPMYTLEFSKNAHREIEKIRSELL